VLPTVNRMRRADHFATVVRAGARARCGQLVVHHSRDLTVEQVPLVGLVVGKVVGGSVTRHAVSRKLRAQLFARLNRLPAGSGTVVRALPGAAGATSGELGGALDAALDRLVGAS
jgi:ribonuclease P protein component